MLKNWRRWVGKNEKLILILLLVIILRIPSLYEPYWYGDEGIYLTLGLAVRKGLVLYRDIHDNKPPLLYWLAAAAHTVFYFRLILIIWFGLAVALFYKLMQKFSPSQPKFWLLASLTMIALTTIFEGNIANAEIFIVLPVTLGMLMAFLMNKQKQVKWWVFVLIGIIFNLGVLFKVPAGFDFGAVMIWLIFLETKNFKEMIKTVFSKKIWLIIAGFILPIGLSLIYYAIRGGFEPYVKAALMQNFGYLASWNTGQHSISGFSSQKGLIIRGIWLGISLTGFWLLEKKYKFSSGFKLTVVWFFMALFGALLSERPYPHYLIQPAIPTAILISYFIFPKKKVVKLIVLIALLEGGWFYYQIKFWQYPIISYYQNFIDYGLKEKTVEQYRSFFDPKVNQNYAVAEYIRITTLPEERIFVWGDEAAIYALANRLPAGRLTVAYHVIDFNGFKETIKAIDQFKPKEVVMMTYEQTDFPELKTRLATDYFLIKTIDNALIYRRL